MFSRPRRHPLLLQVLVDYGAIVVIVAGTVVLYGDSTAPAPNAAAQGLSIATWFFLVGSASGIYETQDQPSWQRTLLRTLLAALIGLPVGVLLFVGMSPADGVGIASGSAIAAVSAVVVRRAYVSSRGAQTRLHRVLIVGAGDAAKLVSRQLRSSLPHASVVGFYPSPNEVVKVRETDLLVPCASLAEDARKLGVDEIIVAVSERRGGSMPMRDLLDCKIGGIRVWDATTYFEKAFGQIRLDFVNASWLIFGEGFRQGTLRAVLKRAFDIASALVLLCTAAPIMLATALLIRLESRGPVLFRQERVGQNGRVFEVLKFRSMRTDAEADGRPRWATVEDDRVTRVGRTIRRLRIDELPQLFNVLAGEMSLVGPRPERPYFVQDLTAQIPYYAVRHSVKPGITGWAQVRYHYGSTLEDAQEKLQYDLYYVKNHSLLLDGQILLETVSVVLTGKGAR